MALALAVCALALVPGSSLALSEGRVYEMVSPVFKGGYAADLTAAAPDGESVAFNSLGAFAGITEPEAGAYYLARRVAGQGWSTTPVEVPFSPPRGFSDFSGDLGSTLGEVSDPHGTGRSEFRLHENSLPDLPQYWEPFGGLVFSESMSEADASVELCHVLGLASSDLLPEAGRDAGQGLTTYDLARGCGDEGGSLRQVMVRNTFGPHGEPAPLEPTCRAELGVAVEGSGDFEGPDGTEQAASFNEVSGDGSEDFFTVGVPATSKCPPNQSYASAHPQLYVRLGSANTVEVSRPLEPEKLFGGCNGGGKGGEVPGEVPCQGASERAGAFFKGASEDGTKVFFTTIAPLVPGDLDSSNKLFMATIGCPEVEPGCQPADRRVTSLTDISRAQSSEPAEVVGVTSVGREGGYVYFVAHGALTAVPNGEDEVAVKGAENLYSYDSGTGALAFVSDLCSGPSLSGVVEDARCPLTVGTNPKFNDSKLWGGIDTGLPGAQSSDDGRYLLFSTYARLIAHGTQADVDDAVDIYRYDAQTGGLDRVSLGEDGHDANGNGVFDASIPTVGINPGGVFEAVLHSQEMATRAISEDGSTAVFASAEPLSANAANGLQNVYVWHAPPEGSGEGPVSMISSGVAPRGDGEQTVDLSGRDVFFATSAGLDPQDTEGDTDIYDARIGGGFPLPPAQRVQCSSDACQGSFTAPAPLLVPGSESQAPGENYPSAKKVAANAKSRKKPRHKNRKRKAKKSPLGGKRGRRR